MLEIIIAFFVGFGVGGTCGYFLLPARQNIQNISQVQTQTTDVWQVQATIVVANTHGITNVNINIKGVTNITFKTNYSLTNK